MRLCEQYSGRILQKFRLMIYFVYLPKLPSIHLNTGYLCFQTCINQVILFFYVKTLTVFSISLELRAIKLFYELNNTI